VDKRFITTPVSRRWGRHVLIAMATAGTVALAVVPTTASAATSSDSSSETRTLQALTGGSVDKFDPSLGTLTQVDWTSDVAVTTELCAENLSTATGATPTGTTNGSLSVTFPAGTVTTASVGETIPGVSLSASNGADNCLGGLVIGDDAAGQPPTFPSGVSASDVYFKALADTQNASGSITDPAALAAFIGPGTLPYTIAQSSQGDVVQSSEWDVTYLAYGSVAVSVTYTYTPPGGTTTTTVAGTLPRTGGTVDNTLQYGIVATLLGGSLVLVTRRRRHS
jgi:LPXTG-motif cell wall-anchored protein